MAAMQNKRRTPIFILVMIQLILLLISQWAIFSYGVSAASTLVIKLAKWEGGDNLLDARGTGPARTTIMVENAVTGSQLGSTSSDREGKWTFKRQLSTAPCSIRVNAGSESAFMTVSGSPSSCYDSQPQEATLSKISITGPAAINEISNAQYTCTAVYSDNSSQNVTSSASWAENSSTTTISGGNLTAGSVSSDRTVTITASFGGKTASYNVTIKNIVVAAKTLSGLTISGPSSVKQGTTATFTAMASYSDGTSAIVTPVWSENSTYATINDSGVLTAATVTTNQNVTITANYTYDGVSAINTKNVTITAVTASNTSKSINSTSRNSATLPSGPVAEQPFVNQNGFKVLAVNDLGMHCGDLDHRVASILPPFNVLHAIAIQQGTSISDLPEILTDMNCDMIYSAASNPNDPALQNPVAEPVFKTNFWDLNQAQNGTILAFDAYDPFYPPFILDQFSLEEDMGLPVPDLALLYPLIAAGHLSADQQNMPGISAPYSVNTPQSIKRFDTDLPFFVNFPFGYRLTGLNWFAADGIPMTPYDDFGRENSFPLMRLQSVSKNTNLTGKAGDVLASVDVVLPVSAEADCYRCHASAVDGGSGQAACIPGIDANCPTEGSPRSNTAFTVSRANEDTSDLPLNAKREWAADNNILRLHDAKHGTSLKSNTPVSCQTCHYTPALDLAHLGPVGPNDPDANGKEQRIHRSNSRVMHTFHGQFTDLFADDMPSPTDSRRLDPATGKPVINAFVTEKLDQSCYQCHPGRNTKCLRGAMFNGGLICQDCHGGMKQVGNDFSQNFSVSQPFPAGADLTKRVPWATVPACQSCHTGDAVSNLGLTDPNVIRSKDGIRLLQAYRSDDTANAKPIVATNKRFAENEVDGKTVLYRLSKGHSGITCEACHGSTHAEWPVQPESGTYIANDNMASIQLQGHTGKIVECGACHTGSLPNSLGGPHGMHPVGSTNFSNGGHENLAERSANSCRACHGTNGEGTVLSKVAVNRTLSAEGRQVSIAKGQMVSCNLCHGNPLRSDTLTDKR